MNRKRFAKFLPIAFLFLLTIAFFYPVIFENKSFCAFDTLFEYHPWAPANFNFRSHNPLITDPVNNIFYPVNHILKSNFEENIFPLWNVFNFCGVVFPPQSSPLKYFFYLLFPTPTGHDALLWFHLFGTGLFMYLYLKEIGLSIFPSLIGSTAWMFNGYVMVWFEFENTPMMAFSLPATLYFFEVWLRTRSRLSYLGLICVIALSISADYVHLLVYQFILIGLYALYRCFLVNQKRNVPRTDRRSQLVYIGLAYVAAICISANLFTNGLSYLEGSHRQPVSFEQLYKEKGQLPAKYLITLLFPDFFGSPANAICFTPGTQSYNNYNELCIYTGIPALFLVLVCIPCIRRKYIGFFLLTAVVSITMAMGSLLYYPLWKFVPGLNLSTPTRILYIFGFSMSVLAALGAEILLTAENKKKWLILTLWMLLLGLGVMVSFFVQTEEGIKWAAGSHIWAGDWERSYSALRAHFDLYAETIFRPLLLMFASFVLLAVTLFSRNMQFKTLLLALGMLALSCNLVFFGLHYNTASPKAFEYPKTGSIEFLQKDKSLFRIMTYGKFMTHSFLPFEIHDAGGYASSYPRRYAEFLHLSQHGLDIPLPGHYSRWVSFATFGSPLLDLINVKYLLIPPYVSASSPKLELVYNKEIKIYENKAFFPRIFFVPTYSLENSSKDTYNAIGNCTSSDLREKVILETLPPPGFVQNNSTTEHTMNSKINIISYQANRIELEVSTNMKAFLVISDSYHPGWKANIDGQETKILRANYIMRAIPVEQGNHRITLIFRPKLLISGFIITAVGWTVLIGVMGVLILKKAVSIRIFSKKRSSSFQ